MAVTASALLMLSLAGCVESPEPEVTQGKTVTERESIVVPLEAITKDGRVVDCFELDGYRAGGLSCDWGNAR